MDSAGWTPLYVACNEGHLSIVRYLAGQKGVDIMKADKLGRTAIDMAQSGAPIQNIPCAHIVIQHTFLSMIHTMHAIETPSHNPSHTPSHPHSHHPLSPPLINLLDTNIPP